MIRVCFLTKYHENGASSRYRYFNYRIFLDSDISTEYKPLLSYRYVENFNKGIKNKKIDILLSYIKRLLFILIHKNEYDLFIIEKELFPFVPFAIEKILLRNVFFSLDYDDNAKTKYESFKFLSNKIDQLVKLANFVTVGNNWYFKDFKNQKNLFFLPTVVDVDKYPTNVDKYDTFSLVWIGSPSSARYLSIIEEPLNELIKQNKKFQLIIIGGDNFKFKNALFPHYYEKWSTEKEGVSLARCHLGIMPLYSSDWDEGKCGFKLIQYLAAGLPIIASNTIANTDIINTSNVGAIANSNEEWINEISHFIDLNDDLKVYHKKARLVAEEFYSYQKWGKIYSQIIKKNLGEIK